MRRPWRRDGLPYESDEASLVRVTRREWEKARRVPAELRAEITRNSSVAEHAWVEAKERSDYAAYLPHLERNVELRRRYAECFEGSTASSTSTTRCWTTSSRG